VRFSVCEHTSLISKDTKLKVHRSDTHFCDISSDISPLGWVHFRINVRLLCSKAEEMLQIKPIKTKKRVIYVKLVKKLRDS
jgi:hypothetical protein